VLLLVGILATCTRSQQTTSDRYWWLGLKKSPFGGRNYNSDEIQRGEHIPQGTKFGGKGGKIGRTPQRNVKKFSKRQAEENEENDENTVLDEEEFENDIKLNEIDTECPRRTRCVERFFCERFSGKNVFDQIPCLLTTGEFAGDFGICCEAPYSRVCPKVPIIPPPEHCRPRPLGDPEDHECNNIGSQDTCSKGSLCCFNGCLNVCLEDPPYSVQKSFFFRQKAFIIGRDSTFSPKPNKPPSEGGSEFNSAESQSFESFEEEEEESSTEVATELAESGEEVSDTDYSTEDDKERSPKSLRDSNTMARVLKRLIQVLRDRIS